MKKLLLILFCSAALFPLSAQKGKVTSASLALETGDYLKAKEYIDVATVHPESSLMSRTWRVRGEVYTGIFESKIFLAKAPDALFQASTAYQKACELEINPKKREEMITGFGNVGIYLFQDGVAKFQEGVYGEAYVYLDESRKVNKFMVENNLTKDLDTNYILITAYAAQNIKKYDVAMELYRQLYAMRAENETVYSNLADLLLLDEKNEAEALEVISTGRKLFPNDKNLIISELNFYLKKGKASDITDKLENAIIADPSNSALYFALGTAYDQLKDYVKAKDAYLQAIAKNPEYYDAYFNLGAMYYNQAVEINRQMNNVPDSDMKTFKKLEGERNVLYNQALPYLEKSHQLNPDGKDSKVALKEIYARMSMFDKLKELE